MPGKKPYFDSFVACRIQSESGPSLRWKQFESNILCRPFSFRPAVNNNPLNQLPSARYQCIIVRNNGNNPCSLSLSLSLRIIFLAILWCTVFDIFIKFTDHPLLVCQRLALSLLRSPLAFSLPSNAYELFLRPCVYWSNFIVFAFQNSRHSSRRFPFARHIDFDRRGAIL